MKKTTQYKTIAEASADGWIIPRKIQCADGFAWNDVSGPNSQGYSFVYYKESDFQAAGLLSRYEIIKSGLDCVRSRTISFSEELNAANKPGCYGEMFNLDEISQFEKKKA